MRALVIDSSNWFVFAVGLVVLIILVYRASVLFIESSHTTQLETRKRESESKLKAEFESWKVQHLEASRTETASHRLRLMQEFSGEFEKWKQSHADEIRKAARETAKAELATWKLAAEKDIRKSAAAQSQATTVGKVLEHMAPYLPGFDFNPKDARFLGTPIDFVVFDGASEGDVKRIVFVEVKTGYSTMSSKQKGIKEVIRLGQIEWLLLRLNTTTPPTNLPEGLFESEVHEAEPTDSGLREAVDGPFERSIALTMRDLRAMDSDVDVTLAVVFQGENDKTELVLSLSELVKLDIDDGITLLVEPNPGTITFGELRDLRLETEIAFEVIFEDETISLDQLLDLDEASEDVLEARLHLVAYTSLETTTLGDLLALDLYEGTLFEISFSKNLSLVQIRFLLQLASLEPEEGVLPSVLVKHEVVEFLPIMQAEPRDDCYELGNLPANVREAISEANEDDGC